MEGEGEGRYRDRVTRPWRGAGGADPEEIGKILPRQRPELEGATRHWQEEESPRYGEGIPHRASDQLQGSLPVPQGNQAVAG